MVSTIAPCPGNTTPAAHASSAGAVTMRASAPAASTARATLRRLPMP